MSKSQRSIQIILFFICFSIVGLRAWRIPAEDKLGGRSSIAGDGYSDINTLSAVRYFYDYGFFESNFRPMHSYTTADSKVNAVPYTHYPALPDILVGVWARVVGSTNEVVLRVFPILLSGLLFFFIFYFLRTWLKDSVASFVSACLLVTSNYFIAWADTLHKHTFEEVGKWVFVHLLLLYRNRDRSQDQQQKSLGLLVSLCLLAVAMMNISFEPAVFLSVATLGFSVVDEKSWGKIFNRLNFAIGFSFVIGFVLHLYLNARYFGSWPMAIQDLREAFLYRTNQCLNPEQCGLTLNDYLHFPMVILNRIERYYWIPGFAMIFVSWFGLKRMKAQAPQLRPVFWILFVASISWYFVMNQHAWAHAFVGKQSGLLWAWISGFGLLGYWDRLRSDWSRRSGLKGCGVLVLHGLLMLYVIAMALTQQLKDLWWDEGLARIFISTAG